MDVATYDVDGNIRWLAVLLELLQVLFHVAEGVQAVQGEAHDAHVYICDLKFWSLIF